MPFKHYMCSVIEAVIEGHIREIGAEDSTVRRWCKWFLSFEVHFWGVLNAVAALHEKPLPHLPDRSGSLLRSIQDHCRNEGGWLAQLVRTTVNSCNWVCTEFAWVTDD
jgi:hypothetical protein